MLAGMAALVVLSLAPAHAGTSCSAEIPTSSASCGFNLAGSRLTIQAYGYVTGPVATITAQITGPSGVVLLSCTNTASGGQYGYTGTGCYDQVGVAGLSGPGLASLTCSATVSPANIYYPGVVYCSSGG